MLCGAGLKPGVDGVAVDADGTGPGVIAAIGGEVVGVLLLEL